MESLMGIKLAAWQQIASPQITVAMGSLGYDWIVLDMEHTSMTTQEAESMFIAAESVGSKPFVRLPNADPYLARRFLDAGASGVFVPVVESREQFDMFAQHCFFPPKGRRGLGLVRANLWGQKLQAYYSEFKPLIIAQIETKAGAENILDILASPYLDGIMIGPYDLSSSLGIPGQFCDSSFIELCNQINSEAKKTGKITGYHQVEPNEYELQQRISEGYDFIAYGTDVVAMRFALQRGKK